MINMPIVDIMTLIIGEVEKPVAPVVGNDVGEASFLSFITGDDPELGRPVDMPDVVSDMALGHSGDNVGTPVARAMVLSGLTGQQVVFVPEFEVQKLDDTLLVLNVPHEKVTNVIQPDLRIGLAEDTPASMPTDLPVVISGVAPALQDTDVAVDVPRPTRETASIPPQVLVPDKQANTAIFNDAPQQVSLPATPVNPQIGSGSFQHNILPPTTGIPRPHMPVSTASDLVLSPSVNAALPMAPRATPKIIPDASLVNKNTSDKQSRHASVEVTEIKESHRGQPKPILQVPMCAANSNVMILSKAHTIATPASIQAPQVPPISAANFPVVTSRPTLDMPALHPAQAIKILAPDNAQMPKVQNPLPQYTPNPPAADTPNRVDPLQTMSTSAPLQPTVLVPQSPKRQTSEGQLTEPHVQPVKPTAIDAPAQSTVPTVQPPITPMPDASALEGSLSDLNSELIPLETRAADSGSIARRDAITNRPEVGRHIAQQLTEAARQMPDRPVELTLNPDELGRVRLTFTMSESGIHVAVIAERGETMDLLRRHIETLAQEFRDMGYKDVNFDFSRNGQGNSGNADSNPDDPDAQTQTPTETQTLAPVQLSLEPSAGLDLRL